MSRQTKRLHMSTQETTPRISKRVRFVEPDEIVSKRAKNARKIAGKPIEQSHPFVTSPVVDKPSPVADEAIEESQAIEDSQAIEQSQAIEVITEVIKEMIENAVESSQAADEDAEITPGNTRVKSYVPGAPVKLSDRSDEYMEIACDYPFKKTYCGIELRVASPRPTLEEHVQSRLSLSPKEPRSQRATTEDLICHEDLANPPCSQFKLEREVSRRNLLEQLEAAQD